jgi:peroxin-19
MADKPKEQVETAPDPDEDDLDDLDGISHTTDLIDNNSKRILTKQFSSDVLDEFNAQPKPAPTSKPQQPPPPPQQASTGGLPPDDELAAQLQAGMADLMGELDSNPEMQREFEKMMAELVQAGQAATDAEAIEHIGKATEAVHLGGGGEDLAAGIAAASSSSGGEAPKKSSGAASSAQQQQESFQDTIRKTMERMQASDSSTSAHTAAAASSPSTAEDDMMAQLMKELQAGGGGGEEDFNKMLMGMMAQLTNKDILYEPMKELHDKFPAWMDKNRASTGKEDLERFEEQHKLVKEIVGRFERKGYSDEDEDDREYIVERMQKVCFLGMLLDERRSVTRSEDDC